MFLLKPQGQELWYLVYNIINYALGIKMGPYLVLYMKILNILL